MQDAIHIFSVSQNFTSASFRRYDHYLLTHKETEVMSLVQVHAALRGPGLRLLLFKAESSSVSGRMGEERLLTFLAHSFLNIISCIEIAFKSHSQTRMAGSTFPVEGKLPSDNTRHFKTQPATDRWVTKHA